MFAYYFKLGLRSLRRNPALTALMVLTLAVGVATSMSTLTVLRAMSGDQTIGALRPPPPAATRPSKVRRVVTDRRRSTSHRS